MTAASKKRSLMRRRCSYGRTSAQPSSTYDRRILHVRLRFDPLGVPASQRVASPLYRVVDDGFLVCRYVPSSTQEPSEEATRLRERLKHRLVELASKPANVKPHQSLQRTRVICIQRPRQWSGVCSPQPRMSPRAAPVMSTSSASPWDSSG